MVNEFRHPQNDVKCVITPLVHASDLYRHTYFDTTRAFATSNDLKIVQLTKIDWRNVQRRKEKWCMSTHFLRSDIPTQLDTFPCRSRWRHTPRSARSETEQTPLLTVWIVLRHFPSYGENWQHYQIYLTSASDKKLTVVLCSLCNLVESCPIWTLEAAERCRSADACWLHKTQYPRILLIVREQLFQCCLRDATHIVHLCAFHKAPLRPFWRCPCPDLP